MANTGDIQAGPPTGGLAAPTIDATVRLGASLTRFHRVPQARGLPGLPLLRVAPGRGAVGVLGGPPPALLWGAGLAESVAAQLAPWLDRGAPPAGAATAARGADPAAGVPAGAAELRPPPASPQPAAGAPGSAARAGELAPSITFIERLGALGAFSGAPRASLVAPGAPSPALRAPLSAPLPERAPAPSVEALAPRLAEALASQRVEPAAASASGAEARGATSTAAGASGALTGVERSSQERDARAITTGVATAGPFVVAPSPSFPWASSWAFGVDLRAPSARSAPALRGSSDRARRGELPMPSAPARAERPARSPGERATLAAADLRFRAPELGHREAIGLPASAEAAFASGAPSGPSGASEPALTARLGDAPALPAHGLTEVAGALRGLVEREVAAAVGRLGRAPEAAPPPRAAPAPPQAPPVDVSSDDFVRRLLDRMRALTQEERFRGGLIR
jgi:hypothetical protein